MKKFNQELYDIGVENFTDDDIAMIIEFAYIIGKNETEEFRNKFLDLIDGVTSGIDLFAMFVKFCYNKFNISSYTDYIEFLDFELDNLLDDFISEYFIEEEKEMENQPNAKTFAQNKINEIIEITYDLENANNKELLRAGIKRIRSLSERLTEHLEYLEVKEEE